MGEEPTTPQTRGSFGSEGPGSGGDGEVSSWSSEDEGAWEESDGDETEVLVELEGCMEGRIWLTTGLTLRVLTYTSPSELLLERFERVIQMMLTTGNENAGISTATISNLDLGEVCCALLAELEPSARITVGRTTMLRRIALTLFRVVDARDVLLELKRKISTYLPSREISTAGSELPALLQLLQVATL
jgi:hypothetical protein